MAIPVVFRYPGKRAILCLPIVIAKELQNVKILYRLIWLRHSIIVITANLGHSLIGS